MEKRKSWVFLLILLFLLIPFISGVSFNVKDSYDQKETLIAKISGNFVEPILKEDIVFYKNYWETVVEFELLQINSDYYIYAQLEKPENNYSVKIQEVSHYEEGEITDKVISRNFSISNKTADFFVNPGVVKTDEDFKINVQNLKSHEINLIINPEEESEDFFSFFNSQKKQREISLNPGEIRDINFELENKTGLKEISIYSNSTKYDIPVYSIVENDSQENKCGNGIIDYGEECDSGNLTKKNCSSYLGEKYRGKLFCNNNTCTINTSDCFIYREGEIYFNKDVLNIETLKGNKTQKKLLIKNSKNKSIENISLELSSNIREYINLSEYSVSEIEENSSKEIFLEIYSDKIKKLNGYLFLNTENDSKKLRINLNIKGEPSNISDEDNNISDKNETSKNNSEDKIEYSETCSELDGQKCNSSSVCAGQQIEASDGECCLGPCELKEDDNTGKIIGWIIVIVIVLFLIWFYLVRYKGIKNKTDLEGVASGFKNKRKGKRK